jgi:hypothetical protein
MTGIVIKRGNLEKNTTQGEYHVKMKTETE